jgi:hypothetical protein
MIAWRTMDIKPEGNLFKVGLSSKIVGLRIKVLARAAKKGFVEIVRMLVIEPSENGILGGLKDAFIPLYLAAKRGFVNTPKPLCKQYPAPLITTDNENRPMLVILDSITALYSWWRCLPIVQTFSLLNSNSPLTPFA